MRDEQQSGLPDHDPSTLLERRLAKLRLYSLQSMRDSVFQYVHRVKSARRWDEAAYPRGTEKELYAQFAHILLSDPSAMIPRFLELFETDVATSLSSRKFEGSWRAYRVSTVRRDRGVRWTGPYILPGCAGRGGIADVALLLNPEFGAEELQVKADLLLYFELKSRDHHRQKQSQLRAHLRALVKDPFATSAYLGSVGGVPADVSHERWLGHVRLSRFLTTMADVAVDTSQNYALAAEIRELAQVLGAD